MTMSEPNAPVTFDDLGKLRLLQSHQYDDSNNLRDDCQEFLGKVGQFHEHAEGLVQMLQEKATLVERLKLRAVNLRNAAENETEARVLRQNRMLGKIKERQAELDRLQAEHASLIRVAQEQQQLIDTITTK